MDLLLWIAAGILAVAFAAAGLLKLTKSKAQLAEAGQGWVEDFSPQVIKLIGTAELLAAIGLIVPPLVDVLPVLAPAAAIGVIVLMAGAAATHLRRAETPMVVVNTALLLLATFVAWGRLGPHTF